MSTSMSFLPSRERGLYGGPLDEARIRAYWDSMSSSYAPDAKHGLVRFSSRLQHDAVMQLARLEKGSSVLDAGAGSGLLTRRLVAAGCDVTALDASPAMLDQLRGVTKEVIQSRVEDLDVTDRYDAVMAIGVLNFVTTPADTLRRLGAAVKRGGVLVLQVTEWSLAGLVYWLGYRARGLRPFLFTKQWLCESLAAQGFSCAGAAHPLPHDLTIACRRERA